MQERQGDVFVVQTFDGASRSLERAATGERTREIIHPIRQRGCLVGTVADGKKTMPARDSPGPKGVAADEAEPEDQVDSCLVESCFSAPRNTCLSQIDCFKKYTHRKILYDSCSWAFWGTGHDPCEARDFLSVTL